MKNIRFRGIIQTITKTSQTLHYYVVYIEYHRRGHTLTLYGEGG